MKLEQLVTSGYQATLRDTHAEGGWGTKGHRYIPEIVPFYESLHCCNILDYGSGQESLRINLEPINIPVTCYDPGRPGREALPAPHDLVVCTDVLEHIEPELLDNVLQHIFDLTIKGAYLHIATKVAKRMLTDGRNAHLIVQRPDWWEKQIMRLDGWRVWQCKPGQKSVKFWMRKQ